MHVVRFGLYLCIANPKAKNKDVLKEKGKHVWAYQCQPQTQSPTLFRPTTKPWNITDTQCRCRCSCAKIFPKLNLKLFPPLIFVWLITLHSVFHQIQMSYQCTDTKCNDAVIDNLANIGIEETEYTLQVLFTFCFRKGHC